MSEAPVNERYSLSPLTEMKELFRGRWTKWVLILGIIVHLMGFMIFRVSMEPRAAVAVPEPYVSISSEENQAWDVVIAEQAILFDSEPLFLPTRWNAAPELNLPTELGVARSPFKDYKPEMELAEQLFLEKKWNARYAVRLESPEDSLYVEASQVYSSFGYAEKAGEPLSSRGAAIELYDVLRNQVVGAYDIELIDFPVVEGDLWQATEFTVLVDALGRIGQPVQIQSSGTTELDRYLKAYIEAFFALKSIKSGYYRVYLGP